MSSQASSAGGQEAEVRRKLVESGDVGVMVAIRSNFFYTRTVPCELWFLNRSKPAHLKDKVLMLDARNVFRKVTRKIFDFSPEQLANLTAIVWLYRGENERFLELVENYQCRMLEEATSASEVLDAFMSQAASVVSKLNELEDETQDALETLRADNKSYAGDAEKSSEEWQSLPSNSKGLHQAAEQLLSLIHI